MTITGNLLCDPNYDYIHTEPGAAEDPEEMWAMFAVMEHVAGESQRYRVKASGAICRMIHKDRLKKGDFVKITGDVRRQTDGEPFIMASDYRLLKKAVKHG